MANFLGQLAKGFIRSAVNQVGRDGGRVVSNSLYGDKHSTPIRHVGGSSFNSMDPGSGNGPVPPLDDFRKQMIAEGYTPTIIGSQYSLFWPIVCGLRNLFPFAFITDILFLWRGIKRLCSKEYYYSKKETVPIYHQDRRYSSGARIDGFQEVTNAVALPADEKELHKNKVVGCIYLFLFLVNIAISFLLIFWIEKQSTSTDNYIDPINVTTVSHYKCYKYDSLSTYYILEEEYRIDKSEVDSMGNYILFLETKNYSDEANQYIAIPSSNIPAFIEYLQQTKDKLDEWSTIAKREKITDLDKLIPVTSPKVSICWKAWNDKWLHTNDTIIQARCKYDDKVYHAVYYMKVTATNDMSIDRCGICFTSQQLKDLIKNISAIQKGAVEIDKHDILFK